MLHNATLVLAIFLVFGSAGLSTRALARGGYDSGGGGNGFRDNPSSGGLRGHGNRASGLGDRFHGHRGNDVWGHWGSYYGPMIPSI
jgi:hypothetical protein